MDVQHAIDCHFEMRMRVKLLDISASGTLLASDAVLPVEARGQLKAVLASGNFSPNLQVRRTAGFESRARHAARDGISGHGR